MAVQVPAVRDDTALIQAERAYSRAAQLDQANSAECTDWYFWSAAYAWQTLRDTGQVPLTPGQTRAWTIYHGSLSQLVLTGQKYQRLDPRRGLTLRIGSSEILVPTTYHGFAWRPDDFERLLVVGDYPQEGIKRVYRRSGLGVPLVVLRHHRPHDVFMRERQLFSTTAVLRTSLAALTPNGDIPTSPSQLTGAALELHNNLIVPTVPSRSTWFNLASDSSAPFALAASSVTRTNFRDLITPYRRESREGLFFLEPYQPGKIPVIFIHGLLSDPLTWIDLANELKSQPLINRRFQLWGFHYPTGKPFLASAAALRGQLALARSTIDPSGQDPALDQMVLVGHSMGGLVSTLQVTYSGQALWQSVASRPLEQIQAPPEARAALQQQFFFSPIPSIQRVIFIATPHGGSNWATRPIGLIGSSCIKHPPEMVALHQQLVQANPGVFSPKIADSLPTSIQMLAPNNTTLQAIRQLPNNPAVQTHSIIGYGYPVPGSGDGDGIVSVDSARRAGTYSEKYVKDKHTEIHHHQETIAEVMRILTEHAAASGLGGSL